MASNPAFKPREIVHNGETKSINGWARTIGVRKETMAVRIKKWEQGLITEQEAFRPPNPRNQTTQPAELQEQTRAIRHRAIDALFEQFEKHLLPLLEQEVMLYASDGVIRPAMRFYLTYKDYMGLASYDRISNDTKETMAQVAVVIQATSDTPQNFTLVG